MKMVEFFMPRAWVGALALIGAAFALAPANVQAQNLQTLGQGIQWSTVDNGVATQPQGPITMVMFTQGQYEIFWRALYGRVQPPPVNVVWGKEYLIGVCAGPQSAGSQVRIQSIGRINAGNAVAQWYVGGNNPFGGPQRTRAKGGSPWEMDKVVAFGGKLAFQQIDAPRYTNGIFFTGNNWNCPPIIITNYGAPDGFLPYEVVDYGSYATVTSTGNVVITNQDQFSQYVQGIYGPQFQVPNGINWDGTMFAGITLGSCPSTGFSIEVMGLRQVGPSQYKLFYSVGVPGPGQMQGQVVTCPHLLVRIPKVSGSIEFVRVDQKSTGSVGIGSGPSRGGGGI